MHDDPGGRMKYKDVELLKRRSDISADDAALIWRGNALRALGSGRTERSKFKVQTLNRNQNQNVQPAYAGMSGVNCRSSNAI